MKQLNNITIKKQIAEGPKSHHLLQRINGKVHVEEKLPDSIYCGKDHILDRCDAFMNQTLKGKIKFLARKKICYGCLQPMENGHNARSCKKRLSCITCKEMHPTPLHGWIPKNKKVTCNRNQS